MKTSVFKRYSYALGILLAFILGIQSQQSGFVEELIYYQEDIIYLVIQHIELVAISGSIAIALAIPIGIVLDLVLLRLLNPRCRY